MILMQYGDTIKGDSGIDGFTGWIGLASCQWGVGRGISSGTSAGQDRDPSTASLSEIVVTKALDITSTLLFAEAAYGAAEPKVTIVFINAGGADKEVQQYLKLELTDVFISGYSQNSGGDRPSESLSLNYTKIVMNQSQFKNGKELVKSDPKGFDLTTGKAAAK